MQAGLGEPIVDNQDGLGFRVLNPDGTARQLEPRLLTAHTAVDYLYRGAPLGRSSHSPPTARGPRTSPTTQLPDGRVVDYVVRRERGTIDRFIYSFAMLARFGEDPSHIDTSEWNRKVIYAFDGGVAIGHNQGTPGGSALTNWASAGIRDHPLSGTRTSTHYNLELGGETALMTKEEFIERYGVPSIPSASAAGAARSSSTSTARTTRG